MLDGYGRNIDYARISLTDKCNLRCVYCMPEDKVYENNLINDTLSFNDYKFIINGLSQVGIKKIKFTGGEPLIQKDAPELVARLLEEGFEVNIETNGAVDLREFNDKLIDVLSDDELLNKMIYTLDYKCPSSGMEDKMILENIDYLNEIDVLKFVVGSQEDLDTMKKIVTEYQPECNIFVSPVFGNIEPSAIVDYVLENNLQKVRVQLQLHKIIWDPATRGV